jgi:hypothetical protein
MTTETRHRLAIGGGVCLLFTLLGTPLAGHGPSHAGAGGVLTLDVYGQGDVLDLLVAEEDGEGFVLRHRRSKDGGATWGPARPVDPGSAAVARPHRGSDPQIAADGDHLLALWTAAGTSPWGTGPLATALSDDGGRSWRPGPNPSDSGSTGGHGYADLLADRAGRFHAVWIDDRAGDPGLYAAVSDDGGRSWSPSRVVDRSTCSCCWNRLALLEGDAVAVAYRDAVPRDAAVAISRDAGKSWTRSGAPGGFDWRIEACPMTGGAVARTPIEKGEGGERVHALVWTGAEERAGLYLSRSDDGGRSWGTALPVAGGDGHRGDLAARDGILAAAWDGPTPDGPQIAAALSADGGRTWSEPRMLSAAGARGAQPLVVRTAEAFRVFWIEERSGGTTAWASARLE